MNKKIIIVLISLGAALLVFTGAVFLENKISNPYEKVKVYYTLKDINKGTVINQGNVNNYFEKKEVPENTLISGYVTSRDQIVGKYIIDDIVKSEQLSSKKMGSVSKRKKLIKNLREYALKFDDISQVVGGTLRSGDTVDLILTYTDKDNGVVQTQTELKNVVIDKAIAQDGTLIKREDSSKYSATVLTLDLSVDDAVKLDNAIANGKIKALKVLDGGSSYDNITVQSKTQN